MFTAIVLLALASSACCFNEEVNEKFRKLPHDEFIKYFNSQNFSYKIAQYDGINEKAVSCSDGKGIRVIPIPIPRPDNLTTKYSILDFVPPEYDGRVYKGHCYPKPLDQGECASCWALATAAVATIRQCIYTSHFPMSSTPTDHEVKLSSWESLSPADLICCKDCYDESFCGNGSPENAALHWLKNGLVTNDCKPYELSINKNETSDCKEVCVNDSMYYNQDKYFGYSVRVTMEDDHEIRREIAHLGPLVATFVLYEDFRDYKEGVYEHTHGQMIGFHTVAVIGYGVENGVPYWLATNTWGESWGQNSTFKVKRFDPYLGFENHMLSLTPRIFDF